MTKLVGKEISKVWQEFKKYRDFWVALGIMSVIPTVLMGVFAVWALDDDGFALTSQASDFFSDISPIAITGLAIAGLIVLAFNVLVFSTFISSFVHIYKKNKAPEFMDAVKMGVKNYWPVVVTGLVLVATVIAGLIALIIPGIIFALWFSFAFYAVVNDKLSGVAALKRSKQLFVSNWRYAVKYILYIIGITFLISITLGLILAIFALIFPALGQVLQAILDAAISLFSGFAMAHLYFDLQSSTSSASSKSKSN